MQKITVNHRILGYLIFGQHNLSSCVCVTWKAHDHAIPPACLTYVNCARKVFFHPHLAECVFEKCPALKCTNRHIITATYTNRRCNIKHLEHMDGKKTQQKQKHKLHPLSHFEGYLRYSSHFHLVMFIIPGSLAPKRMVE